MNVSSLAKHYLPAPVANAARAIKRRMDFKVKWRRESPVDYITQYDHRSLKKARKSILWHDDWDQATAATMNIVRELDLIGDGLTVVDYGCGIGRMSKPLVEDYAIDLLSVDRSEVMLEHARNYLGAGPYRGTYKLLNDHELLEMLPEMRGKIDLVLFVEVLQHIPEPILDDLMPRLLESLSPRGRVLVLGNALLDVDAQGNIRTKYIRDFLPKHFMVERHDQCKEALDSEGRPVQGSVGLGRPPGVFKNPREVFVCAQAVGRVSYS